MFSDDDHGSEILPTNTDPPEFFNVYQRGQTHRLD